MVLVERLRLDCGMRRKPALYLAGDRLGARALAPEVAAHREIGIGAEYLGRADLTARFGIGRPAAIRSTDSASANPAQLAAGLLRVAPARSARVVSPVEITDMADLPGGVALATRRGEVQVAGHAVFCTGYEYLPQIESAAHRVTSIWALASRSLKGLPGWMRNILVWEASDPNIPHCAPR